MKELDCVELTQPFEGLPAGTKGTVVLVYPGPHAEVEFFDGKGETVGVFTVPTSLLKVTWAAAS